MMMGKFSKTISELGELSPLKKLYNKLMLETINKADRTSSKQ
jgi:hypothetical protein